MLDNRNPLKLLEASERLYQIKDLDALLERVLGEARAFVNADAGTLYMAAGNNLYFSFVQNDTLFRGETKDKYIPSGASLPIDKASIAGYVARTGEAGVSAWREYRDPKTQPKFASRSATTPAVLAPLAARSGPIRIRSPTSPTRSPSPASFPGRGPRKHSRSRTMK